MATVPTRLLLTHLMYVASATNVLIEVSSMDSSKDLTRKCHDLAHF